MSKLVDFFKSHHIQLAMAAGVSIIALGYTSKHVLPEPMGYLPRPFPLARRHRRRRHRPA